MHDIRSIRDNPEAFDAALFKRNGTYRRAAELIALDEERRSAIQRLNEVQETRNAKSKQIGQAKAQKDEGRAEALMGEVAELRAELQRLEEQQRSADAALRAALEVLPNLPLPEVPRMLRQLSQLRSVVLQFADS